MYGHMHVGPPVYSFGYPPPPQYTYGPPPPMYGVSPFQQAPAYQQQPYAQSGVGYRYNPSPAPSRGFAGVPQQQQYVAPQSPPPGVAAPTGPPPAAAITKKALMSGNPYAIAGVTALAVAPKLDKPMTKVTKNVAGWTSKQYTKVKKCKGFANCTGSGAKLAAGAIGTAVVGVGTGAIKTLSALGSALGF